MEILSLFGVSTSDTKFVKYFCYTLYICREKNNRVNDIELMRRKVEDYFEGIQYRLRSGSKASTEKIYNSAHLSDFPRKSSVNLTNSR